MELLLSGLLLAIFAVYVYSVYAMMRSARNFLGETSEKLAELYADALMADNDGLSKRLKEVTADLYERLQRIGVDVNQMDGRLSKFDDRFSSHLQRYYKTQGLDNAGEDEYDDDSNDVPFYSIHEQPSQPSPRQRSAADRRGR